MNAFQLAQTITSDIFDYRQLMGCLRDYAKPRDKIRALLAAGDVVRVKKGLYVFGKAYRNTPVQRETLANLIYGPSYVSLDYALAYYQLIPERVEVVTSVTTAQPRRFETPLGAFTYRTLSLSRYRIGLSLVHAGQSGFLMATPEKALCDKVWDDKTFKPVAATDIHSYLMEDLRMDRSRLGQLDKKRLREIARGYTSPKVDKVVAWMANGGEQE
jgi:hypothetical protein